jgi:cell division transport system ATP-binding protein
MITFDRVSKRYEEGHDALREVSVDIDSDELVFLTGHSGAGKSTLLRLIMLMDRTWRLFAPVEFRSTAAVSAWYSRITSCCLIGRSLTMLRFP